MMFSCTVSHFISQYLNQPQKDSFRLLKSLVDCSLRLLLLFMPSNPPDWSSAFVSPGRAYSLLSLPSYLTSRQSCGVSDPGSASVQIQSVRGESVCPTRP